MISKIQKFLGDVRFEMSKVSWPTWDELKSSTYVVLTLSLILILFLFCCRFYSCKNFKHSIVIMQWYTLRVISGKEKKIKDAILYDVSMAGFNESIGDILVPSENIVEMRDGKKKVKEKVFSRAIC